MAEVYTCT